LAAFDRNGGKRHDGISDQVDWGTTIKYTIRMMVCGDMQPSDMGRLYHKKPQENSHF
jgi:hypothetical protein